MAKYLIWVTLSLVVFSACDSKSVRSENVKSTYYKSENSSLYRQRILNSSNVIYRYTNYGEFAWSNWHSGKFILDSTENVDQTEFIKDLLPFYYTKINLDSNVIEAIDLLDPEEDCKEGMYEETANGITYKIKRYYTKRGSDMGLFYIYHNLTETKDSIFFEKLTVDGFGIDLPNGIGFRKGNVTVEEDSVGFVNKITVTILNQYPLWEKMRGEDTIYMNNDKKEFTGEDLIYLPPLSLVYTFKIELIPDSLSKNRKVSDYGVYKRVKF